MKLVRLWLLLVRNSNWRIRYNLEGGSISNRLFYCYTVSFYEKEYCLFCFFSIFVKMELFTFNDSYDVSGYRQTLKQ